MLRVFLFLVALVIAAPAVAQDASAPSATADPTWANLLHTLIRFNAFDLNDPALIDEYGAVTECDLYKAFFTNDFKWNQVREAMRKSAQINVATYPIAYHYDIRLHLDRYDFTAKLFRFTDKSRINNVNVFNILEVRGVACDGLNVKSLPTIFRLVVPTPVYMDGLPLSETDAKAVLKQMDDIGNSDRVVYARFNLRATYIAKWRKVVTRMAGGDLVRYGQAEQANQDFRYVRIDGALDGVEFYSDPQMTRLIYRYEPQ